MSFLDDARGALIVGGPDAVLCDRSAAYLLGLVFDAPDIVDVLVPWRGPGRAPDFPGVRVRRTRAQGRRPPALLPVPHTDIVDTVLDLAHQSDAEGCVYWLTEATRRGLLPLDQMMDALISRNRHRHRTLIKEILEDLASGVTSNLEVRWSRDVERAHALPKAVRQFIVPETGHRADFAYPDARLLIEVDGSAYHSGEAAAWDAALDAVHGRAGWLTLRYRWGVVAGVPCATAYEVARILRERGVQVAAQPCRREREAS